MKNNLAKMLNDRYNKGVSHGWNGHVMANVITMKNANDVLGFMTTEQLRQFVEYVETEQVRIFTEDMHSNPDAVELLVGHAIQAREEIGLSEEPLWDAAYGRLEK